MVEEQVPPQRVIIMRKFAFVLIWLMCLSLACNTTIKYKDDVGFLVSAQANSPEFPIYIQNKLCRDMDGNLGACTKRIKSNESVNIKFDPQPYAYTIHLYCSKDTNINFSQDVKAGDTFNYSIQPSQFNTLRSFTCVGEIFPLDRVRPVSAKFEVRFIVFDEIYTNREQAYLVQDKKGRNWLVLGQYAKNSRVYDCLKNKCEWKDYLEETIVRVYSPEKVLAYSQSYAMRYNLFGNW